MIGEFTCEDFGEEHIWQSEFAPNDLGGDLFIWCKKCGVDGGSKSYDFTPEETTTK
jgi:hypothetical protein